MINPLVDTRIEVPDGCAITAERHNGGVRFVELAAEMIAESAAVDHDGPP